MTIILRTSRRETPDDLACSLYVRQEMTDREGFDAVKTLKGGK